MGNLFFGLIRPLKKRLRSKGVLMEVLKGPFRPRIMIAKFWIDHTQKGGTLLKDIIIFEKYMKFKMVLANSYSFEDLFCTKDFFS